MTHTPAALVPLVCLIACAPSTSPSDVIASSETTALASSSDDNASESETTAPVSTSGASSTTGTSASASATADASSQTDTTSDASSTGPDDSGYGRYLLTAAETTIVPDGCGTDSGPASNWSLELREPAEDGTFSALETYGGFVNELECSLEDSGFACAYQVSVDYAAMGGPDAAVHLTSHYEASWDDGAIAGVYAVDFACEGTECDAVAEQWNVVGFPCDIDVSFSGERDPRDDG